MSSKPRGPHRFETVVEAALDGLEDAIRRSTELQRSAARVVGVEPARSILHLSADLTRDLGAAQLSGLRWLLDA
jgi:hypothetical protein